jgi:hypothetical protein
MSAFEVSFNAVVPIFLMMILGFAGKKLNIIGPEFVNQATKFVFRISLPAMVFNKVASIDLSTSLEISQVYLMIFCSVGIIVAYLISRFAGKIVIKEAINSRGYVTGAFMQGVFRSNYIIIGYPVLLNLFGDEIVVNMALVTLIVIPFSNIFSIVALTRPNTHNSMNKYKEILINVLKNPLIIGIILGFGASYIKLDLPFYLDSFIVMTANLATPLALVAIGAFFHFDDFKDSLSKAVIAVSLKLFVLPIIMTSAAYILGFSPMNIILIGVLFGGPTAVSSFAMSSEMEGDSVLSGNIVILSSGLCVISYLIIITTWISILNIV